MGGGGTNGASDAADPPAIAATEAVTSTGIGTLNESPLHAGIKKFLALPGDRFEVPLEGFVIDIVRETGDGDELIEIQTGSFGALGNKLDRLLGSHRIRIVHPIAEQVWIARAGRRRARRSPRRGSILELFGELVSLPTLLSHPNLSLEVLLIDEEQLRGPRRGLRARVLERRLRVVRRSRRFDEVGELLELLPVGLEEPWTTAGLAASTGIRRRTAQAMAYCLKANELIVEVGRDRGGSQYAAAR